MKQLGGGFLRKEKDSRKIIITIGWLSAILAIVIFPVFLSIVAICMGVVLRKDYELDKHGWILIIMGVAGGIVGMLLGAILIPY
ncbi:hypothetical protein LD39_04160 [Halobacillus sp. BBL2006]|nr:hypothetical protein LD39_04160 [Halobacillus sp. BBL2006]